MATYVLIHGAGHGGWCWDKVVPLLRAAGHNVEAPDLPGHGEDKTPISRVTLQAYTDRVCRVLDAQPEPVVLVGHSMGGIVITQAAESRPEKVGTLVYLTAVLAPSGVSILQTLEGDGATLEDAMARRTMILSADRSYVTFEEGTLAGRFYNDCSEADVARARPLLVPQALAPLQTPIRTTEKNFGRIPRVYIECLLDKAVPPEMQKGMYTALPCRKVISMHTGHSPFFSAPEDLAKNLVSL